MVILEAKLYKNRIYVDKICLYVVNMAQKGFTRTGGPIFIWRPTYIFWGYVDQDKEQDPSPG